jgi:hypothetical protein
MDGLEALTSPVGPNVAAYNAGLKTARDYEDQQSVQAMRQAQMQEILQRTAAAKEMQPYDIQAKQQAIEKGALANKAAQLDVYTDALSRATANVSQVSGPGMRHTALLETLQGSGIDMNNPEVAGVLKRLQTVPDDKLPDVLTKLQDAMTTQSAKYKQALAVAETQKQSHLEGIKLQGQTARDVARIGAASREAAAASKAKGTQSIQEQVRSGKMTAEKAAVALYGAAQFATDPMEQQQLMDMARQYEQFAMNQRQAGLQGKPDVGAATGLPTQSITPALGQGGPKLGTKENPIVLK